jgi:RNA polymerase sigma-70 factor (ECF subfamily)
LKPKTLPARHLRPPTGATRGRAREARLFAAARNGDATALTKLLERAAGPAHRFSTGFCRNPHDAEDLVQDVLATLMHSLKSFRGESSLSTWTYIVAKRACARMHKRQGRQSSLDDLLSTKQLIADASLEPERRFERRQLGAALEHAIASLPVSQRQVMVLRDVEGLPAAEVGRVLGLGERAIKSRLHRARLALRHSLAPFVTGHDAPAPSMECPDTARLLSRYLEGELTPGVCARLEGHVSSCPACGGTCDSLREVLGACRKYGEQALPADVRRAVRMALRQFVAGARAPTPPPRTPAAPD